MLNNNSGMNNNINDEKMTREEVRNLMKAMDREGFDSIMEQYVKEISDPNNQTETNQYLREAEKTNDLPKNVRLAEPKKGLCIKSEKFNLKRPGVRQKVYINICQHETVNPPKEDDRNMWSLPHLLNKGRNDQDKKGNHCMTFDVIFNPLAIKLAQQNIAFKKFVCDTSINGLNNNLLKANSEKISQDYQMKKYDYKGKEVGLINIHSLVAGELDNRLEPSDSHKTQIQKDIDELKKKNEEDEDKEFDKPDLDYEQSQMEIKKNEIVYPIQPKYKIKYSDDFQLNKYFYNPNQNTENTSQYNKLVVEIDVPLVETLGNCELQLDVRKLLFKYKEIYLLNLDLLVDIDKDKSEAKFDRKKNLLTISAMIVKRNQEVYKIKEDENIEYIKDEDEKEEEDEKMNTKENIKKEELAFKVKENIDNNNINNNETVKNNSINDETTNHNISTITETSKREFLELENKSDSIQLYNDKNESLVTPKTLVEVVKDEDDLPEINTESSIATKNSFMANYTNNSEETIKISYINFNSDIIYEIE